MRQNFADQDPAVSRYNTFRDHKEGKDSGLRVSLTRGTYLSKNFTRRSDFILISPRPLSRTDDKIPVRLRPAIIIHSAIDRGPFIASSVKLYPLVPCECATREDRKLAKDSNRERERRSQNVHESVPVNCLVIVAIAIIYDP